MPAMALSGIGMLFLLQGFELFPKVTVQKPWPRYILVYTLIVYSVLIGAVLVASVQQTAILSSWVLLVIPGVFITISGSVSSFFLGRKKLIDSHGNFTFNYW
jgi:predicted transcriptional regulator